MNDIQSFAGINITASRLEFIELEKESSHVLITNAGQAFLNPSINFDQSAEDIILPQIHSAFDEIKIRNGFKSNFASFTLPPELFLTIQLPYDANLNQNEIREEFNWEISQLFPFVPVEDLALKFYELENKFLQGKNNALVVALPKKFLVLIKNFCSLNNLQPKLVDNASIAANSFINSMTAVGKNVFSVNLYNSRNSITLFINFLSKPAFVKVFNKQDSNYINSIIKEFKQDLFGKILDQSQFSASVSGEVIGSDSLLQIEQETRIKFEIFSPFDFLKFKSGYDNYEIPHDYYSSFTPAAGVASRLN